MDILRRYGRGELTAAILNALNLPERTLRTIRKDREKITVALKAGAGSVSNRVSLGQSTTMVRLEKMLVTWMDHRKCQGLNMTFGNTKKKIMECYHHLKEKEMGPVPEFITRTGWFYKFKSCYAFCSGRRCLNVHTSQRRSLPLASKRSRTVSPSCWGLT